MICRQPKWSFEGCGYRHHRLLHGIDDRSAENQIPTTISGFVVSDSNETQQILLQTAKALLVGDGGQNIHVRVLLDSVEEPKGRTSQTMLQNHWLYKDLLKFLVCLHWEDPRVKPDKEMEEG